MNEKSQEAVNIHINGFNCAQATLSVFAKDFGLDKNLSLKLATAFGAGIVQRQEMCGAVTGSLMAIGLKYGKGVNGTNEDKLKTYDLSCLFMEEFKKQHGSLCCRELLDGLDMKNPEDAEKIKERNFSRMRCDPYIRNAVEIVEKIMNKV